PRRRDRCAALPRGAGASPGELAPGVPAGGGGVRRGGGRAAAARLGPGRIGGGRGLESRVRKASDGGKVGAARTPKSGTARRPFPTAPGGAAPAGSRVL